MHGFSFNVGDLLKVGSEDMFINSPANPDKHYTDSLRVEFRFWDGKDNVYVVVAEDGIEMLLMEKDAVLQEAAPDAVPTDEPKTVTQDEYLAEVSKLNEEIRKAQIDKAEMKGRIDRIKLECRQDTAKVVGCLDSVKAMLQHSTNGVTHRQRNFFSEAIVAYIDNVKGDINTTFSDENPF